MSENNFINYLLKINLHPETYLDNKLILIQNNHLTHIPVEINNCLCCSKHTNSIMSYHLNNCKCPCRHFKRILQSKLYNI